MLQGVLWTDSTGRSSKRWVRQRDPALHRAPALNPSQREGIELTWRHFHFLPHSRLRLD
jgi:hypothetical protein